jgi:hypothetical protein
LFDDLIPQKPKAKAPGLVGGLARSFTEGVPVVGPAIRNASAALSAALAPSTDQFLEDESQKLPGATFGERYQQARSLQDAEGKAFAEQHPIAAPVANAAGAVAGTIPFAETALGAKALGLTGSSLLGRMAAGAASNAAIGAADATVRGEDPIKEAGLSAAFGALAPTVGGAAARMAAGGSSLAWRCRLQKGSAILRTGVLRRCAIWA